jgi:hypothetical protein
MKREPDSFWQYFPYLPLLRRRHIISLKEGAIPVEKWTFLEEFAKEIVFEVAHGYKKKENTHVYVTSGIGLVGPQFRIGTVSEIAIITILFRN